MGTREYPWITCIEILTRVRGQVPYLFIQRDRDGYHTTRTHGYPLTSIL